MKIIDCPSKESLSAFALGNLTEVEVDLVAEHLDSCPACCEKLRRLDERVDTMMVELRRRLAADRALSKDGSTTDFDRESARGFSVGAPLDLDDFRIVRELGRGGMGIVYEAFQGSLNRHVALKFLPEDGDLARFQREARAAGRLHHTNIVPVFGIGEHKGRHFYVMQFIAGRGFDVVRREWAQLSAGSAEGNRPDCRAVARLGIQVADALAYAHAQGVQHRDIKPSNLLLDTGGTVWVADFGLAKDAANNENLTHTGDFLGTLRYTPPERLSGRGDERGDIYSLGLTIYELLTGRPAFHEEERAQLLDQVLHYNPPSPRQCDPSISRDMETIVLKAMAREPDQRYATAAALAEDLRRFVEDRPIRARRASLKERLLRWRRRNPAVAGLLAALIVVLLTGFAAVTWQWRTAVAEREQKEDQRSLADSARLKAQAEETKAIESREQAKRSLYYSLIDRARLERQSNNVAEAEAILDRCPTERRGWEWHFLKGLNNAELFKSPGHSGAGWVDAVAYSPDGRLIASAGGGNPYYQTQGTASIKGGEVILWDAETGRPLRTLREHNHLILNLAISPDGRLLASTGLDGTVKLHEIATGNLIRTLVVASSRGVDPRIAVMGCPLAFNHDSKRLATRWYQDRLAIWDLTSGERVVTLEPCVDGYGQAAFSPDGRRLATASSINAAFDGGEVRLWDPDSGKELIRFDRHASIARLAFSTDSRTLAGANRDGVFLFDLVAGQLRRVLTGHTAAVCSVAFSPDGLHVASGGADATVRIWGIDSGGTERVIRGHTERIESIAYSPDGQRLASGSRDGLKVWDLTFDPEIADIAISQIAGGLELVRSAESIAYSADGHEIVSIDRDGRVVRLESMTHSLIDQMGTDVELGFFTPAAPACFSGDGSRLVLIDPRDRRQALLLRSRKNSTPIRLRGHEFPLRWLTLSADCSRVATSAMLRLTDPSGPQSETMVWDDAGNALFHRSAASELPRQVALDPSGHYLAMAGVRLAPAPGQAAPSLIPFMIVVDVDARNEVMRVDPLEDECLALSFSPDGSRLAGAGLHRSLWIWQFQDRRLFATSRQAPEMGLDLAFSPDGRRLAVASRQQVKLMDAETGDEVLVLRGRAQQTPNPHGFNPRVRFSPDGARILAICDDQARGISEWSIAERKSVDDKGPQEVLRRRSFGRHLDAAIDLDVKRRFDGRLRQIEAMERLQPSSALERLARAVLEAKSGRWDRANADFAQAADQAADPDHILYEWGNAHARAGHWEQARQCFDRLESRSPFGLVASDSGLNSNAFGWSLQISLRLLARDHSGARSLYGRMFQRYRQSRDHKEMYELARASSLAEGLIDDPAEGLRLAEQARDLIAQAHNERLSALILIYLGAACDRAGDPRRAEKLYLEFIGHQPSWEETPACQARLAIALCHQGRWAEARKWLDKAEDWARIRAERRDWSHSPSPADFPTLTWWDLLIALNEAKSLILDHDFPADPFSH